MYEIIYSKESVNFLEQLSKSKSKKIVDVIDKTGLYPYAFFKPLRRSFNYGLTLGKIRVIADVAERKKRIEITKIAYRSRAYLDE